MRLRSLSTLVAALAIVTVAESAGAQTVDEQAEFKKGRYAYQAKSFDDADALFKRMLDPQAGVLHDKVLVNEARMYWGATLIAKGRRDEAVAQFDALLTSDPKYEPDPSIFPLDVATVFIDRKANAEKRAAALEEEKRIREQIRKREEEAAKKAQVERLKQLEKLAGEEYVTEHHSRFVALVPGGVGQFQNGKAGLGWFFLTLESAALVGGIVTVPIYLVQLHDAQVTLSQGPQFSTLAQEYNDRANLARAANLVFYGALAITAIAGAIEAEADYVPDPSSTKPRKLPDLPGVSPDGRPPAASGVSLTFGAAPVFGADGKGGLSGAMLGVGGRF